MKRSKLSLLLVFLLATATSLGSAEVHNCPPPKEIPGCTCYPSMSTLICEDPIGEFKLSQPYTLKSMVIRNTVNLPAIQDTFIKNYHLTVETLLVNQDASSANSLSIQNLESLFGLSTETIRIQSVGKPNGTTGNDSIPLDITDLGSMQYITLIGLTLQTLNLNLFTENRQLKSLVMQKIDLIEPPHGPSDLLLHETSITTLEMSGVTGFMGSVLFEPANCDEGQRINIRLRNNEDLKSFEFSKLFPKKLADSANCRYHIDLSGNEAMDPNLLISQAEALLAAPPKSLYLILRNINVGVNDDKPLLCDCKVKQAALAHKGYFHGIYCKPDGAGKETNLLDHMNDASFKSGCVLKK